MEWIHNQSKNSAYLEKQVLDTTFQRREVILLKISTGRGKPAIVVVGGEVARDWITTAIILNYVNYLLANAQTDKLVEHYDFYFIPVANPDGYAYSLEKASYNLKQFKEVETDNINWYHVTPPKHACEKRAKSETEISRSVDFADERIGI